jgi:hypothetical protein
VDPAVLVGLAVRVHGPPRAAGDVAKSPAGDSDVSLVLSLDGARPRPVVGGSIGIAELLDEHSPLEPGAHDLVLAAVGSNGVALEPDAGGVASARFFVGRRPATPPPSRFVCLSPFGTYYGRAPAIALDFVLVPLYARGAPEVPAVAAIASGGAERRARAVGGGPFALGDFEGGDHLVTVTPAPGASPVLPGRCIFAYNPEIERSP